MRCKPGDLAIIYKTSEPSTLHGQHIGKIVKCIRVKRNCRVTGKPVWETEPSFPDVDWLDDELLPIRPPEEPVMVGQLEGLTEKVS